MSEASNIVTVSVSRAALLVHECMKENVAVMLWGAPGIGKSELAAQLAKLFGLALHILTASLKSPVDLAGIPVADLANKVCIWLRPEDVPDYPVLLFIDEININSPSMQAALMQLVLERRVGPHHLHPETVIVAAGNRLSDRAAAQRMPSALCNRFAHFNIEPDIASWAEWARIDGVDPRLVGFLEFRPMLLHVMPGATADDGDYRITIDSEAKSFPSPRAWVRAARFLDRAPELRQTLVGALVGNGPAAELEGFLRVVSSVPTLKQIIDDPQTAPAPKTDPAAKYAVSAMLCRYATRENFDVLVEYATRLGNEFAALTVIDATRRNPDLKETGAYTSWATSNSDTLV